MSLNPNGDTVKGIIVFANNVVRHVYTVVSRIILDDIARKILYRIINDSTYLLIPYYGHQRAIEHIKWVLNLFIFYCGCGWVFFFTFRF